MSSNHGYETPKEGATSWHIPLNDNFRSIDSDVEVRDVEDNLSEYVPNDGAKFLAVDTGRRYLGRDGEWTEAPSHPHREVVLPQRTDDPADAAVGELWYREDVDEVRTQLQDGVVVLASGSDGGGDARTYISLDSSSSLDQFTSLKGTCDGRDCDLNRQFVSSPTVSNGALEIFWPEGSHQGAPGKVDLQTVWGYYPEEAWGQYYLRLHSDWQGGPMGGKLPGWDGVGSCGSGGSPCDGTNGFSARGGHEPGPVLGYYIYDGTMDERNETYGDHHAWDHSATPGEWMKIDQHIKLNTPGVEDGVLEAWVDDELVYRDTSFYVRDSGHSEIKIESWWFATYWGGGDPSPQDNYAYFDEMKISDEPINPTTA